MPPHHPKHRRHRAERLPSAEIDRALAPFVPDPSDRAFILRCVLEEGPAHHRGASFAILRVLSLAIERLGAPSKDLSAIPTTPLTIRLPPHLAEAAEDNAYPIGLPTRALREALGDPELEAAAVDALCDGPAHHALANAMMLWLIEAILSRAEMSDEGPAG